LRKKNLKCSFSEIEKKSVVVEEHAQWAKIGKKVEFREMLQQRLKRNNIF